MLAALALWVFLAQQSPTDLVNQIRALLEQLAVAVSTPQSSNVVRLKPGDDIQKAIDQAKDGAELRLAPGLYSVNLLLRAGKTGVTIRTDLADSAIALTPGGWIDGPAMAGKLARLVPADPFASIVGADRRAHDYTLVGLEIGGNPGHPDRTLVDMGPANEVTSIDELARNLTIERCYIHGDPVTGGHLGVWMGAVNAKVLRSDVRGFLERGRDSQAVGDSFGVGPYTIERNYLEASGENVLFGGADPTIPNAVPSDIVIRYNLIAKPASWRLQTGSVKNLLELKNAQRVVVAYNVLENVWADAQAGSAVVISVRNQDGRCPWCVVRDVLVQSNVLRNVEGFAFNLLARDDTPGRVSVRGTNLVIDNNLAINVRNGVQILDAFLPTTITRNTLLGIGGRFLHLSTSNPIGGNAFAVRDNVVAGGLYGITGDNTTPGLPTLTLFAPAAVFTHNVIEGNNERTIAYPAGNVLLLAGQLAAHLDALDRYDAPGFGVDLAPIRAALPWAVIP